MSFKIEQKVNLAGFTTFKIGGEANFFVEAKSAGEILQAIEFAEQNALEIFILGGGSNVLIADAGFSGLVIKIALEGIEFEPQTNQTVKVTAQAGEDWDALVAECVGRNLQGFECLSGIPGLVGGTPVQNVGAYGQEVSETIVSVKCFDRKTKQIVELTDKNCGFSYRTSIFNSSQKNRFVVLAVNYLLKLNHAPKIEYRDLQNYFGETNPTLQQTREAVLAIRCVKSMVIDENDPNSKSAGSFFKNPIVSRENLNRIEEIAEKLNVGKVPRFEFDEKNVKIPAAWLIENSGFTKGHKQGRAGISSRHALALVNLGNATAQDILSLKDTIEAEVKNKFGVELKTEPVFVGFP